MTDTIKISRELAETIEMTWRIHDKHSAPTSERGAEAIREGLRELRQLLATTTTDAADMGGQAGEKFAWRFTGVAGLTRYITESKYQALRPGERRWYEPYECAHCAQHRQQAGKLVEALRKIHFRADCFVEDDRDMPVTSIEAIVRIAGEALAAWDVKP
jgi:hypothetical protein